MLFIRSLPTATAADLVQSKGNIKTKKNGATNTSVTGERASELAGSSASWRANHQVAGGEVDLCCRALANLPGAFRAYEQRAGRRAVVRWAVCKLLLARTTSLTMASSLRVDE